MLLRKIEKVTLNNFFIRQIVKKQKNIKKLKVNESQYIVLFVVSKSIKNLLLIDFANIYIFSIFFSMYIARWKSVGLPPHIVSMVIH